MFLFSYLLQHHSYLGIIQILEPRAGLYVCTHQRRDHRHRLTGRRRLVEAARLSGQAAAPPLEAVRADDLLDHADGEALLEAAELAAVPPPLVHRAVLVRQADVLGVLLDGALEEALAALARAHAVVLARRIVAAHRAQQAGTNSLSRKFCLSNFWLLFCSF